LTPLWLLGLWAMMRLSPADLCFWIKRRSSVPNGEIVADPIETTRRKILSFLTGLTLVLTVIVVGFFIFKSNNYGGWTCGPRWFMWLTRLWLLALLRVADQLASRRWGRGLGYLLLAVSIFSVSYPLMNPWRHPWLYRLMEALGWPGY